MRAVTGFIGAQCALSPFASMTGKMRIDQILVERGLAESRTRAQALVMAGLVYSGESKIAKSGQQIAGDAPVEVRSEEHTSELQSLMRISSAVFCLKKTTTQVHNS